MNNIICNNCNKENNPTAKYCSQCGFTLPKIEILEKVSGEGEIVTKKKKNNTILGIIFGLIFFYLAYFGVQFLFNYSSIDKKLVNVASELNKSCPIMIDSETRLDNSIALPNKTFQYNYTLVSIDDKNADVEALKSYLNPIILNTITTNPDMKEFRENNVILVYNYKDKNSKHLFKLTFYPNQYKK